MTTQTKTAAEPSSGASGATVEEEYDFKAEESRTTTVTAAAER